MQNETGEESWGTEQKRTPEAKLENERRAGATKCGLNLSSNAEQLEIVIELKLKIEFQI